MVHCAHRVYISGEVYALRLLHYSVFYLPTKKMDYLFYLVIILCLIYIICDVNYVLRTCFTVFSGRLCNNRYTLRDVTTVYGVCTFQDCDVGFKSIRMARLIREIDFARYHFYDRTGIYHRSRSLGIRSLQGATFTISMEPVPLFVPYKINTKLTFWDQRSIFFEHEVVTLRDNKVRCLLISRQYGIGTSKETISGLLKGLPGSDASLKCPEYIKSWLQSMNRSSFKLRNAN